MRIVNIKTSKEYKVFIEKGISRNMDKYIQPNTYGKYLVLTDENVDELYGNRLIKTLEKSGKTIIKYVIAPGEISKSFAVLEELLEFMARNEMTRSDVLIAFGGGVVGDLGGFVAGIYQRGIDYIQIPTTLLAAVDSSVGGKTAINLNMGKNLVGVFKQPSAVICDSELFESLDGFDFSCGVAEITKYSIIFDDSLFKRLKMPLEYKSKDLDEIIEKCIGMKAKLVLEDEYDYGKRQLLNLGHTIGHGIERASEFKINHGHAVAMGMGIMARACANKGICSWKTARDIENVLKENSLPINTDYFPKDLLEYCKSDKKSSGDNINIVIIKDIGKCEIVSVDFNELGNLIELGVMGK